LRPRARISLLAGACVLAWASTTVGCSAFDPRAGSPRPSADGIVGAEGADDAGECALGDANANGNAADTRALRGGACADGGLSSGPDASRREPYGYP
jgi:hypothetical protein